MLSVHRIVASSLFDMWLIHLLPLGGLVKNTSSLRGRLVKRPTVIVIANSNIITCPRLTNPSVQIISCDLHSYTSTTETVEISIVP